MTRSEAITRTNASSLSPLEAAGLRLDAAIAVFDMVSRTPALNESFGDAEEEYLAAQAAYRDVLREITGADPEIICRRLAR